MGASEAQQPPARPSFDAAAAGRFLGLLGKDPAASWFRSIRHGGKANRSRRGRDLAGFNAIALEADSRRGDALYVVMGAATDATGKAGGVTNADVVTVPAFWAEWDDQPVEWQLQAWRAAGLPEPSVMVTTGGNSAHLYWVLDRPMPATEWREIERRLLDHLGADSNVGNPGRVMRLPGSAYIDKRTGKPTGTAAEIVHESTARYSPAEIAACLPPPPAAQIELPPPPPPQRERQPRGIAEVREAAAHIPQRVGRGGKTYERDRNALCGCSAALDEAGSPDPDGEALALLGGKWPSVADAAQVLRSTTTRNAASFWAIARNGGYRLSRSPAAASGSARSSTSGITATTATPATHGAPQQKRQSGPRRLSHARAMACFERCIEIQAAKQRNTLARRARLLKAAADLGLSKYITRADIAAKVLEAKDRAGGRSFRLLTAVERVAMERPTVEWLIPGVIPAGDLTILGGRPKVGKTRLAMRIVAAVLNGSSFLETEPATPRPVILVTDDQSHADTADGLIELAIWEHPALQWSKHFRLTETDTDALLTAIQAHPGALVVIDSLRSITRSLQTTENDPELGAAVYDLKDAAIEAGGSLLLIHHCNKAEGLTGIEALSGHSSISGAANTVLTLHHLPDDKGRPLKTEPQRRLVRDARTGEGFDLVLSPTAGTGEWRRVGCFDDWQRSQREADEAEKRKERMPDSQKRVMGVLQDSGQWLTRRQVCEALGAPWGDRGRDPAARKVEEALRSLVQKGMAESSRGGTEATFRIKGGTAEGGSDPSHSAHFSRTTRTTRTISHAKESERPDKTRTTRPSTNELQPVAGLIGSGAAAPIAENACGDRLSGLSGFAPVTENDCGNRVAGLSGLSGPEETPSPPAETLHRLAALRAENPDAAPQTLALLMDPDGTGKPTWRQVKAWLSQLDQNLPQSA